MSTGENWGKTALTCRRRLVKIIAELTNRLACSEGFKNAADALIGPVSVDERTMPRPKSTGPQAGKTHSKDN
ncbi:MAG: hypothetical protein FWG53_11020 [Clostridiales bacterium]|nr:hypothetical protein [Clostridiales bacterium]